MSNLPRWVIVLVVAVAVIGLVAFARGRTHHRGDEVGVRAAGPYVSIAAGGVA
jgi:hypothetical protein